MAVAKGFKQTEAGVIPDEWESINIGALGEVRMCKRVFNHQTSATGAIPFYKIGTFGKEPDAFISRDLYDSYRQRFSFPKKGDVLISAAGTIGRTIVYNGEDAYFQDSNIVWVGNNETRISNELFYHVLQIVKYNTEGGTIQRLYNSILRNAVFALPPKEEQEAIANALSDADALIESIEKLIAKKRLIKKGAMQELLTGKRRLPGFNGDWTETTIGEMFIVTAGTSKARFIVPGGRYGVCDMGAVTADGFLKTTKRSNLHMDLLRQGDLVMPKDDIGGGNIIGKVGYIDADNSYILGDHVYCLRALSGDSRFLGYLINSAIVNSALRKKVAGSAQLGLGRSSVLAQAIIVPSEMEQKAISSTLLDIDNEIELLSARLIKARLVKQGMMQELLTGRIRLI